MKETVKAPGLDDRRTAQFSAELLERARSWIPSWALADGERDFGRALLEVAARFNSEVAERLDRAGEKMRRGFLDWLAVRGRAARPARIPVVFQLAESATEAVLADAPIRMQVDVDGASVIFETENDVRLVPGRLATVIGVDGDEDAVYLPPPGLSDLEPLEPLPTQWQLKSFAPAGAKTLQVDPETGLKADMVLEADAHQYRITKVDGEIITIDPPLAGDLDEATSVLRKVTTFAPFDGKTDNRQEHALYLGHKELLDIESEATIHITGAQALSRDVRWEYWGKTEAKEEEADWRELTRAGNQDNDALVLHKDKGAIEPSVIDGRNSRWIRAVAKKLPAADSPFQPNLLAIKVNAVGCNGVDCKDETAPPLVAEGMANTTPLVLGGAFLPLGREPRQFDAFYLGSTEAFSKKGASVQLCFDIADPSFASLSRIRNGALPNFLAGVGGDSRLHLLRFDPAGPKLEKFDRKRDGLQPQPENGAAVALDKRPPWRVPMWNDGFDFFVAVTAKADVWVWKEVAAPGNASSWMPFGPVPAATATSTAAIDGLVYLEDTKKLVALRDGVLSTRGLASTDTWTTIPTTLNSNTDVLKSIAPVLVDNGFGRLITSNVQGLVGISNGERLFHITTAGVCTLVLSSVNVETRPAAAFDGAQLIAAAVDKSSPQLVAMSPFRSESLEATAIVQGPLDATLQGGEIHFVATVTAADKAYFAMWAPYAPAPDDSLFKTTVASSAGEIGGAPTILEQHVIVPGTRADVIVGTFDITRRFDANSTVASGIALPLAAPVLANGDFVARMAGTPELRNVTSAGTTSEGEIFYEIDSKFSVTNGPLFAYDATPYRTGSITNQTLKLEPADQYAKVGEWLLVDDLAYEVQSIDKISDPNSWIVTMTNAITTNVGGYAYPLPTNGRTAAYMDLNPATDGNWDAALLNQTKLVFPLAIPEEQSAKAFKVSGGHPDLVVMAEEFTFNPPGNPTFIADGTVGPWTRLLGDTSSNPELSWEYWNGTGWWKLDVELDQTLNLKNSGGVRFKVPDDIASGDWAGRTNFWIRARLVGGDYGKEQVTVITKPGPGNGEQTQTIDRSTAGVRAPSVMSLRISYRLCKAVRPVFVLAQDSRAMRDQSEANKTSSAVVEAFVPLARTLGRLTNPSLPDAVETGRALFIGLDATPSGSPVNVLLIVANEEKHEPFAPMKIEALVADRFVPIVAEDTTRALGESGLLSMSFTLAPTPRELFGMENLTWLRLTPDSAGGPVKDWKPSLRGAYLNAVWASAAETLTRELLGSSEGAPNLVVRVARPPVLADSLELRVREPLGEEEREKLGARVRSDFDGLPGDWVLWDQVLDPLDDDPDARVYALDESTGEIRFGDGQHGMIPPIGRDSIVAFAYRRTEIGGSEGNDVPANAVVARTALNLVSPVKSVEAVFAADRAAGGARPENGERVVRFGTARLRHRGRAITARDFEDLALESSPDIVQARCFAGRGHVCLVVVMRGDDPRPDAAEVRELKRLLLASSSSSLSATDALRITGPNVRRLRIQLTLRVAALDVAGDVARDVQARIAALFDTTSWPLGAEPTEGEIALALLDTPALESLADVQLREVQPDGAELPWSGGQAILPVQDRRDRLSSTLVMLDKDPVRLEFETVEVFA
ncbi:MAG TPA: baseplate J/gp47 family protein [Thermoanaerobaculia bacterium]|nr:baseplate J/gp47 family protein [Thermoanaerobaculia bacterium]